MSCNLEEQCLLDTMSDIIVNGYKRPNRTGTDTRSLFGKMFEYHMEESIHPESGEPMYRLPLLTTKKMFIRGVFQELKWFLNGGTDSKDLEALNVNIWKGNTSKEYLDKIGLGHYEEGETGPIYGFQWRHWGAEYIPGKKAYSNEGIDQVKRVVESLKNDPYSRRHIISGWNVQDLDKMCLPPCLLAGSKVLTKRGYIPIEEICGNDLVYTHKGRWRSIANQQVRDYSDRVYSVWHLGGSYPIKSSKEHPFLVMTVGTYTHPEWLPAKSLKIRSHMLCIPIETIQEPLHLTICVDGSLQMIQPIDYEHIGTLIGSPDYSKTHIGWSIVSQFISFGELIIPEWVQRLPKTDLRDLVKGFESVAQRLSRAEFQVESYSIGLSLQRIYAKIGLMVQVLCTANQVSIRYLDESQGGFIDQNFLYLPITRIAWKVKTCEVYNIEVQEDESFVVDNIATHNCHVLYQFMVHENDGTQYLSLMMTQRSCDTFLGLPFNLCSLGFLLAMTAATVGMKPYKIIHSIADMHLYEDHIEAAQIQISRKPLPFPYVRIKQTKPNLEDYSLEDIEVHGYQSCGPIKATMAV